MRGSGASRKPLPHIGLITERGSGRRKRRMAEVSRDPSLLALAAVVVFAVLRTRQPQRTARAAMPDNHGVS